MKKANSSVSKSLEETHENFLKMNIQTSKDEDFLKINDVENRLIDFKISPSFEGRVSLKK
jgi:hypothetical protein